MQPVKIIIYLLSLFLVTFPVVAEAFWGNNGDKQSGLNFESGYDANTVTTITGRIISVQTGNDHRNVQIEIESNGTRTVVVLAPQSYWSENGIALKAGDDVTVRGSKAQGSDGVEYMMAQKITDTTQKTSVSMRNESGRPAWAGGGIGNGSGQMINRPAQNRQQSPGRMGGGRMGR